MSDQHPSFWQSGDAVIHRTGAAHTLKRRKLDNSGWWLWDGGGLNDKAAVSEEWWHLTPAELQVIFAERQVAWR
jgi:hypothetical protein